MSYRTLEEKFLADFEELENENKRLRDEIAQLQAALSKETVNRTLDVVVETAGRLAIIKNVMPTWNRAKATENNFDEWVLKSAYENELPKGVSIIDFIAYFEKELVSAYEDKYADETIEGGE